MYTTSAKTRSFVAIMAPKPFVSRVTLFGAASSRPTTTTVSSAAAAPPPSPLVNADNDESRHELRDADKQEQVEEKEGETHAMIDCCN